MTTHERIPLNRNIKIYELNKLDHFRAEFSEEVLSGVFLGMDGAYAKVQYHGVEYEPFALLHATTIVKKGK